MQHVKGGIYYIPKGKHFSQWWKHDRATWVAQLNFCSTVTVISLGALWHPTLVENTKGKKRRQKYQQKTHSEVKRMRPGRAELPVHHSEVLWMATEAPRVRFCGTWTLPKANVQPSCQVLGEDNKIPLTLTEMSTKLQYKGHIRAQSHRGWMVQGLTEAIMLYCCQKVWGRGGS